MTTHSSNNPSTIFLFFFQWYYFLCYISLFSSLYGNYLYAFISFFITFLLHFYYALYMLINFIYSSKKAQIFVLFSYSFLVFNLRIAKFIPIIIATAPTIYAIVSPVLTFCLIIFCSSLLICFSSSSLVF